MDVLRSLCFANERRHGPTDHQDAQGFPKILDYQPFLNPIGKAANIRCGRITNSKFSVNKAQRENELFDKELKRRSRPDHQLRYLQLMI